LSNIQEIMKAIGKPTGNVYAPSEDTFLMIDALSALSLRGKIVLDLGTGSGILGLVCAEMGAQVTVADIEDSALTAAASAARKLNLTIQTTRSNIFSNIPGRFDIVLFNPPYLPSRGIMDSTVDGGSGGRELVNRFLDELPIHLNENGFAFLLVSSLTGPRAIIDEHQKLDFSVVLSRSLFFEELQVLSCKPRNLSGQRPDR